MMTYAQALEELRKELNANSRILSLLTQVAAEDELALYRTTARIADHAPLVHATASAASVRAFVDKITAQPKPSKAG